MCILQTDSFTSWAPVSICYTILSQDGLSVFGSELDLFGNTGPEVAIQKFVYEGDADSLGSKTMGKCRRKQKLPVSNGIMCQKMGYFYSKLKLPPASGVFTPWPPQGGSCSWTIFLALCVHLTSTYRLFCFLPLPSLGCSEFVFISKLVKRNKICLPIWFCSFPSFIVLVLHAICCHCTIMCSVCSLQGLKVLSQDLFLLNFLWSV